MILTVAPVNIAATMERDDSSAREYSNDHHRGPFPSSSSSTISRNPFMFPVGLEVPAAPQTRSVRDENELLPESFQPGNKVRSTFSRKVRCMVNVMFLPSYSISFILNLPGMMVLQDVICGRQRENFHHEGNKYFRELIQKNIGPYIGSRTKLEKGDAIIRITQIVNDNSPSGGFVKKDERTGRWYRISDSEARDKVGHAIRKAVQRLEDTKPAKAARLRKEFETHAATVASESAESTKKEGKAGAKKPKTKADAKKPSAGKQKMKESGSDSDSTAPKDGGFAAASPAGSAMPSISNLPVYSDPILSALSSRQSTNMAQGVTSLDQRLAGGASAATFASLGQGLLTHGFSGVTTGSLMSLPYDHLLALRLQDQRSQDELALIRALQQKQEEKIRREIEYNSQRILPIGNSMDPATSVLPWRMAATGNPFLFGQYPNLQVQLQQSSSATASMSDSTSTTYPGILEFLKKQQEEREGKK